MVYIVFLTELQAYGLSTIFTLPDSSIARCGDRLCDQLHRNQDVVQAPEALETVGLRLPLTPGIIPSKRESWRVRWENGW